MHCQNNIVVIFNDDHAQWALGAYGNRALRTPTLDYLASSGVLMGNAFTPTPVCSPARACFLTGRLASQAKCENVHRAPTEWNKSYSGRG